MLSKLRFRPTLWPTLFSVPAVIVMIALCVWQVHRLHWKEGLIADRESRIAAEPAALPPVGTDPAQMEYRRVRLEGMFLHDKELYLGARSMNGNVGYHVLTPFALAGGGSVLVDRGWVPVARKLPERR
ncbi:MAG TPA: SURF1 family protein, partial [Dongiaceae bacterium]|nr:SURF1 family protein [Dongiaceae bacterium]